MMAVWLSGLTREERERFQMLRRKFAEIQVRTVNKTRITLNCQIKR